MPETPKLFRKKSKVKTWFNGLAREVLTGEDLPVRRSSITIFLSQNVIVVFDLTEVVMYFVYLDKCIVKKKLKKCFKIIKYFFKRWF